MKRGDIFLAAVQGDYGKPRPVIIVQRDDANEESESVIICLLSSTIVDSPVFRPTLNPAATNGLNVTSQIMVDKIQSVRRKRLRKKIGCIDDEQMLQLNRSLAFWLGLECAQVEKL